MIMLNLAHACLHALLVRCLQQGQTAMAQATWIRVTMDFLWLAVATWIANFFAVREAEASLGARPTSESTRPDSETCAAAVDSKTECRARISRDSLLALDVRTN